MRAAIFQSNTATCTPDERLERLQEVVTSVDTDLLLCPELYMYGYPELAGGVLSSYEGSMLQHFARLVYNPTSV